MADALTIALPSLLLLGLGVLVIWLCCPCPKAERAAGKQDEDKQP